MLPVAGGTKRLQHPALGVVTFQHTVLLVADQPDQTLVSFSSADISRDQLARLAAAVS